MSVLPVTTPAIPNRVGSGAPNNAIGNDGDTYLDRTTGRTWERAGGNYGLVFQPTLPTNKLTGTIDLATQVSGLLPYSQISGTPKITKSSYAGGPPASPADGDIWRAVHSSGKIWNFVYNSSEVTYKWIYLGGSPLSYCDTSGSTRSPAASSTWEEAVASTSRISSLRAGYYKIRFGGNLYSDSNTTSYLGVGPSVSSIYTPYTWNSSGSVGANYGGVGITVDMLDMGATALSAGGSIILQMNRSPSASYILEYGWLEVEPQKII